jgi:hypothetical protein
MHIETTVMRVPLAWKPALQDALLELAIKRAASDRQLTAESEKQLRARLQELICDEPQPKKEPHLYDRDTIHPPGNLGAARPQASPV